MAKKYVMIRPRHRQGFTLIEILVVLVVAGTLSGIGIAGWQGAQRRLTVDAVVNQVISTYQAGRFQAIRRGGEVAVFQDGDEIVSFPVEDDGDCEDADRDQAIGSLLNWRETLPPGHVLEWGGSGGVIWQATGLARACAGGLPNSTISISADGEDVVRLTIVGPAGRIARVAL